MTRQPSRILPRDEAEIACAEIAREVVALTRKGLAGAEHSSLHISDARALAVVLQGLTCYVRMFERNP